MHLASLSGEKLAAMAFPGIVRRELLVGMGFFPALSDGRYFCFLPVTGAVNCIGLVVFAECKPLVPCRSRKQLISTSVEATF